MVPDYVEWSEPPAPARSGFATPDCCFLFGVQRQPLLNVEKSPDWNVYLYIPHPMTDPVLDAAITRLASFEAQTFWDIGHALQTQYASWALALRGRNADRATFHDGPGGVGQSLNTHRLAASVGPKNRSY